MSDYHARYARRPTPLVHDDALYDFRTRLLMQQAETAARRQQDLLEQSSDVLSPASRIRIWERLHHARLPASPSHPLLKVIAANTRLTPAEISHEQRVRFGDGGAPAATAG